MKGYLSTSEIAIAVGVHPNTVRLYEEWGFLPPVPRSPSGYRLFRQEHLDQMRLSASGDMGGALEQGYRHLALVQAERAEAEAAADLP